LQGVQLENFAVTSDFPRGLRSVLAFTLVSALAFLSGCGGGGVSAPSPEPPAGITVISVSVSPASASINTGQPQNFAATVRNDSQNKGVTWALSGTGCTGSACGTLSSTSSASGAPITYTAPSSVPNPASVTLTSTSVMDATKSGAATIAVTVPALKSVAVTPANPSFSAGLTQQFTATGTYSDGSTQNLTNSVSNPVTWSSSNTSVATIAASGLAKGVSTGTATIQAASGAITGSTTSTVSAAALVSIAVTPANPSVALGLNQQFTATGTYTDGSTQNLTSSVKWSTSNTTVTTISPSGLALGLVKGSTTIQAASGSITGTTTLVVSTAALSSIAVTPATPAIAQGVTQQFTAIGTYTDSSTLDVTSSVTWSSSDQNIATISSGGLATGGASGDSTIQATYKSGASVTGTTTLTVSSATLSSIAVTPPNASIAQGLTEQFSATGTYSDGSTHDLTTTVKWSSLNTTIATIAPGGLAKAVAVGTATIQAQAAFGSTSGTTTLTVNTAHASVQGQWKTLPYLMPINPIHMAVMHNGKVLVVAGSGNQNQPPVTDFEAAVWDPQSGNITTQPVPWDMFCNGMVVLPDGKPFIFGGTVSYDPFVGAKNAGTYDPASGTFANQPSMAHGRWYPTGTVLPDGRVMVFSGLDENSSTNTQVEIFTEGSGWGTPVAAGWTPPSYPRMHVLPNGKVFYSGSSPTSRLFDPSSMTWTSVAVTNYPGTRTYGSSVLLPLIPPNYKPTVFIMGGGSPGSPATATSELIDLSVGSPQWVQGPPMSQPRIDMNATLLPNGKILLTAGSTNDEDATTASLNADLYDPVGKTFSSAGANVFPRLYHSEALLLPDATVAVAGGNPARGQYEHHLEIYSPAYLFNADGSAAARPAIANVTSGPISYGANFQITTPDANNIASVVVIRASAVTHSFDMDQRLVVLNFSNGGTSLTATAPPNGNIAPPGYYLLFLVNKNGVPSVGSFVQITAP
jgi:uncharacterized protein YjdB